jgi:hypothetical protein
MNKSFSNRANAKNRLCDRPPDFELQNRLPEPGEKKGFIQMKSRKKPEDRSPSGLIGIGYVSNHYASTPESVVAAVGVPDAVCG